nr:protein translocase subunit SecF [Lachnospiraceae bacterium]
EELNRDLEEVVLKTLGLSSEIVKVTGENTYIIKTEELSQQQRADLTDALVEKYNVDPSLINTTNISGRVSSEMRADAVKAVIIATIFMLIYIWVRFKDFNYASSSVIALVHDVLMVLTAYAFFRISAGNTFIACMLTLVGYSINATIVVFDRIRENMGAKLKKESVDDIVNKSITQSLSRCINTSLTTAMMVIMLVIFGVESIREFAAPMLIGFICGGFSSVFFTGFIWGSVEKKLEKKRDEAED